MLVAWPLALLIMAGTFREFWILPSILPSFLGNKLFLAALTTPIVFGPGRQFFVNSFRGLRHGVAEMTLLNATGIGAAFAAYAESVPAFVPRLFGKRRQRSAPGAA